MVLYIGEPTSTTRRCAREEVEPLPVAALTCADQVAERRTSRIGVLMERSSVIGRIQ